MNDDIRSLTDVDARQLKPGDSHYQAYVGPPEQYDLMGAMQFRLLTTLGLRDTHKVLDFGCGSLRAGRLLIPYLNSWGYFALEPNAWLIEDAIERQLGRDIIRIKQPIFAHNDDFIPRFGATRFDFILAQSIFSHTGLNLVDIALRACAEVLAPRGIIVATFSISEDNSDFAGQGWVYPACVRYQPETVIRAFAQAGLDAVQIPFFHPRQRWFLGARQRSYLPGDDQISLLHGAVLNVPEFAASCYL